MLGKHFQEEHNAFSVYRKHAALSTKNQPYFAIYLLTPSSLEWHLTTSLTRLMSQLLPSIIFLAFICSRSIEDFERKSPEIIPADPQESV
jgi:hypothetical protein